MGKKSEQYCTLYRITNNKTGEAFEGRKWKSVVTQAGLNANNNRSTLEKSKKWTVEVLAGPEDWNQSLYRKDLYAKTKHRYPEYEHRKAEREPKYEIGKKLFRNGYVNADGSRYTLEQYKEDILIPCECCKKKTNLVVDHCHQTNVVRGTLCRSCNLALGFVEDNPQILYHLITYIEDRKNGKTRNL